MELIENSLQLLVTFLGACLAGLGYRKSGRHTSCCFALGALYWTLYLLLFGATPRVFYLLVFEPEPDRIRSAAITVALSFATFENVCYLIQNGADRFSFIFFRGFGTGAMHVLCGLIVGGGLAYTWQRTWLKIAGTCGLLGAAITFHAIYNLLIARGGAAQYVAYALPAALMAAGRLPALRPRQKDG